jgi:DnaJ-domain-containing protein 1
MEFLKSPKGALILALVYFVFPLDLVPDIFGPIGRVDDLADLLFVAWRAWRVNTEATTERNSPPPERPHNRPTPQSPLEVFDLPKNASRDEIERRYKELALQYHPDRVEHLGDDLKKLAHEKMIQIQAAYQQLLKEG